jgi:hypothetical protein
VGVGGGEPGLRQKAFEDVGVGLRMLGSKDKQVLRDSSESDGARERLCVLGSTKISFSFSFSGDIGSTLIVCAPGSTLPGAHSQEHIVCAPGSTLPGAHSQEHIVCAPGSTLPGAQTMCSREHKQCACAPGSTNNVLPGAQILPIRALFVHCSCTVRALFVLPGEQKDNICAPGNIKQQYLCFREHKYCLRNICAPGSTKKFCLCFQYYNI